MSVKLKPGVLKIKNDNGEYEQINNLFAADTIQLQLDEIENKGTETLRSIETKAAETLESIPEDYTELNNNITDLKEDLKQNKDNFIALSEKMLNSFKLKNNFIYGRYLTNGFADVTTYARNKNPYPAGKYEVGPYAARGYVVVEYLSDTQGGRPIVSQYTVTKSSFTANNPFYITFNGITEDSYLDAINAGFDVKLIASSETLESRVEILEEHVEPITDVFKYVYSKNRYDETYIDKGGYVVPTTGAIGNNTVYSPTEWIDISNHGSNPIVYSQKYGFTNYAMRYALYDADKTYITGALIDDPANVVYDATLNRYYVVIQASSSAKYMRFSMTAGAFTVVPAPEMQIEYTNPTAYEAYSGDAYTIKDSAIEENNIIKELMEGGSSGGYSDIVNSMTYGKKPLQATAATLTSGNTLIAENNSVMKNQYIAFMANIDGTFNGITVGHGQESYGYYIVVDSTNMTYGSNGSTGTSISHGLTIEEFIGVIIEVDVELNVKTTIITKGGYFTRNQQINSSWRGNVFATSNGTTFNNVVLTWNTDDYKCPLWAFGDSYFTLYSPTRWPYYIANKWGFNNILLNAYPGENSERAYSDLVNALTHGTPKYLLWCLGMNDPDGTSTTNESWLTTVQTISEICEQKGITLVLTTIPNVINTAYKNTYKNTWIRNSGIRYVDFASALAEIDGWLSNDDVHPNEIGGRFMALKLLTDVPEIAQGK